LSATQVVGGNGVTGTVTLLAPAPSGGVAVTLASSDPLTAAVNGSVTVTAGATTATFTVTTQPVTTPLTVTLLASLAGTSTTAAAAISASLGSAIKSATLTLLPQDTPAPPTRRINVFRPSTGDWSLRAADGSGTTLSLGAPGDLPVPADYLGTGVPQIAVFH